MGDISTKTKPFRFSEVFSFANVFCAYLFLFPLLPTHVGFYIAPFLPVLKPQRILTLCMIAKVMADGKFLVFNRLFLRKNPFAIWVTMFLAVACMSGALSSGRFYATGYFIAAQYFENIFFAILVYNFLQMTGNLRRLTRVLSWSALLLSLLAIGERLSGTNLYSFLPTFSQSMSYAVMELSREGSVRVRGSFDHPISFGCYLVLALPAIRHYTRGHLSKALFFFSILGVAIFFSQSRTAMMGLVVTVLFVSWWMLRKSMKFAIFSSGMVAVTILISILNMNNYQKIEDTVLIYLNPFSARSSQTSQSTGERVKQFHHISSLIEKRTLFGYGYDSDVRASLGLSSIDSFYLSILYFFGIAGLVSYILFQLVVVIKLVLSKFRTVRELKILLLSAVVSFDIMISTVSLVSFHFMFWIYIGILCSYASDCRSVAREMSQKCVYE